VGTAIEHPVPDRVKPPIVYMATMGVKGCWSRIV